MIEVGQLLQPSSQLFGQDLPKRAHQRSRERNRALMEGRWITESEFLCQRRIQLSANLHGFVSELDDDPVLAQLLKDFAQLNFIRDLRSILLPHRKELAGRKSMLREHGQEPHEASDEIAVPCLRRVLV